MAYNRKNLLKRIIDVQEIYLEHKKNGSTDRWIHREVIYPSYRISERTLYNYLCTPAKKELKELKAIDKRQMQLF